jgi:DNA-binding response OmpR family regulator
VQVNSGVDALARLRHEHFDAITLDVFMPGMNGFDVLRAIRDDPRLREIPVVFVSVASRAPELAGEWAVPKPIDRARLTEVIGAAIQARRSRVLVVAPEALRTQLTASLEALCVEHHWESTAAGAMQAGQREFFEVALVHESMGTTPAVVDGTALRGRRYGRSVIVFSTEGEGQAAAGGVGMPVFGLPQAVAALRTVLGERAADGGR